MIQRETIPETGMYETVKSTPLIVDDQSTHAIEYRSYLLSMSVFKNPKDILHWFL